MTNNRDILPANNGAWPNLLKLNVTSTNQSSVDDAIALSFYTQTGTNPSCAINFFLDADANPYTTNNFQIFQTNIISTGTTNVSSNFLNLALNRTNTLPGSYNLFARINDGVRTRYLYAPQKLLILPSRVAPRLSDWRLKNAEVRFFINGSPGQTTVVQTSSNLLQWVPISTNVMGFSPLEVVDASTLPQRYYRAALIQ